MAYELTEIPDQEITEPVTLAEMKAYMRVDADYVKDNSDIEILIETARVRLEQYLNVGIAKRDIQLEWYGHRIELPLSPINSIVSVSDKDGTLDPGKYTSSGFGNGYLSINDLSSGEYNYFYSRINFDVEVTRVNPFCENLEVYTAIYNCGYEIAPKALKQAVMAEVDYLYKLKGMPVTDLISPNASRLASGYSKNLVL